MPTKRPAAAAADRVMPPQRSRALAAAIRGARVRTLDDSGHAVDEVLASLPAGASHVQALAPAHGDGGHLGNQAAHEALHVGLALLVEEEQVVEVDLGESPRGGLLDTAVGVVHQVGQGPQHRGEELSVEGHHQLVVDQAGIVAGGGQVGEAQLAAILERCRLNLESVRRLVERVPAVTIGAVGGGWSAVLRIPTVVDEETLATNKPGIYAGGDSVTGPSTVVDAVAAGKLAARSIHEYIAQSS